MCCGDCDAAIAEAAAAVTAEPNHSHLKGGIDVSSSVGDSAFHTSLRGASLLRRTAKWYHQILQKVQNLMPHDCIPSCTVYTVVQRYALVDYYCFRLTSGTSTAVGPSIVHRNRKRFLLSQSTLREEFVKKKYQVFDLIGLLTILVPSEPLFPGGASLKAVEFWSQ